MSRYTVKISGKDLSIEHSVDGIIADRIAQLLINNRIYEAGFEVSNVNQPANNHESIAMPETELSAFITAHNACGAAEIVTCIGLYLNKKAKLHFTKGDYHGCYKKLKGRQATNAPRELQKAIRLDWIIESSPGLFSVTSKGRLAAHAKFVG